MTQRTTTGAAKALFCLMVVGAASWLSGCAGVGSYPPAPSSAATADQLYKVGPLDSLNIVVWRNPDL